MDTDNHNEMNAILLVDIQNAVQETESQNLPSDNLLSLWAQCAYNKIISFSESDSKSSEVTIRLVTELEMTTLNRDYRGQNKSTNVLSFAVDAEPQWVLDDASEMPQRLLGDIVICHAVIEQEAQQQGKTLNDHYAHMVTHGILHLCGYDHQDTPSAEEMEALETEILSHNAIANPYT